MQARQPCGRSLQSKPLYEGRVETLRCDISVAERKHLVRGTLPRIIHDWEMVEITVKQEEQQGTGILIKHALTPHEMGPMVVGRMCAWAAKFFYCGVFFKIFTNPKQNQSWKSNKETANTSTVTPVMPKTKNHDTRTEEESSKLDGRTERFSKRTKSTYGRPLF